MIIRVLFLLFSCVAISQNSTRLDVLKTELQKTSNIETQIDLNIEIASILNVTYNKDVYNYAKAAFDLSVKHKFSEKEHIALLELAKYQEEHGLKEETLANYMKVIVFAEAQEDYNLLSRSYNNFATYNIKINEHETAILYFLKSLNILGGNENKFNAYHGLANLYISRREFGKSCENATKALDIAEVLKDKNKLIVILSKLGKCTMFLKDYALAETYLNKTIVLSEETGRKKYKTYSYLDLGQIYWNVKNDTIKAISFFEKGYQLAEEIEDARLKYGAGIALGNSYIKSKNIDAGIKLLKASFYETQQKDFLNYSVQSATVLAAFYEREHVIDSALIWNKRLLSIKDSLASIQKEKIFREAEVKHEVSKKNEAIKDLTEDNSILKNQNLKIVILLLVIVLISILVFFFYKKSKNKAKHLEQESIKTNQEIEELKNIVIKDYIVLKDKTRIYIDDLLYIKSEDHYLNVVTNNAKSHLVRGKLVTIVQELPPNFAQCHRSYIVNKNFIRQINGGIIILVNKDEIPLSRNHKDKFN